MSKISPGPTEVVEQARDSKVPFGSSSVDSCSSNSSNTAGHQTKSESAFSIAETMHTTPFTPSAPISEGELKGKLGHTINNMALPGEIVANVNDAASTQSQSESQNVFKPVVTPETSKADKKELHQQSDASNPVDSSDDSVSPPLTPPRVTSVFSKGSIDHPRFSPPKSFVMPNRGRVLSLDRGQESSKADYASVDNASDFAGDNFANSSKLERKDSSDDEDDEDNSSHADSSEGESSYFAKHLPSPRSDRRFSHSSNHSQHSAPARTTAAAASSFYKKPQHNNNKPSDASLSFSDESDDEEEDDELPHHAESPEPVSQLPRQVTDMQLQRITRVHSVSSLVSSTSGNEDGSKSPQSTLSRESSGTSSDPSVTAELQTVVASSKQGDRSFNHHQMLPSGRRSPLPGNAAFIGYYNISPPFANPSPPTIVPGYNVAGMPHPQPQMMTQDQLAAWLSAGHLSATQQHHHQQKLLGGSNDTAIPFVYSDDETDDTPFMNQLAGHGSYDAGYNTFSNGGGAGGGNQGNRGSSSGARGGQGGDNNNVSNNSRQGVKEYPSGSGVMARGNNGGDDNELDSEEHPDDANFQVYWQRWIMLFYMSILNLLSDWTCYSVAPIAILTRETFGDVDPERLVVIFLGANAISTACEPILLARLGLRKTVLFGALFLMLGSMVKSGGLPPIIQSHLVKGQDEWRLSLGFFLVGLSQPLYQCTPALLSASWFPERERTMATGVALNANQLGIGCAFIFGTLLVADSDDIPPYFGLLSIISTVCFLGTLFQFDDAPPTPPSGTAKVMRGDLNIPDMNSIVQSVRKMNIPGTTPPVVAVVDREPAGSDEQGTRQRKGKRKDGNVRRRSSQSPAPAPSPVLSGRTRDLLSDPVFEAYTSAPSPMMPGPTQEDDTQRGDGSDSPLYDENGQPSSNMQQGGNPGQYPMYQGMPYYGMPPQGQYGSIPPPNPYYDPRMMQQYPDPRMQQYGQQPYLYPPPPYPYYYGYQNAPPMYPPPPPYYYGAEAYTGELEEGAEPVLTVSDHKLDINIRDDQVILSTRLCLSRPGFIHALVAFTVSGIVINTLSTFMDYLVRLNGAGREYVGIVGGSFQIIIMCSSLVIGKQTDRTRAYYSVIIAMLVLGAFGLAECGVSLEADRGTDLRWSLLAVAALVGPLQPVSTELGVDVVYPLSENTVLVIQQLFSNLLSALFIPIFKSLKDVGISNNEDDTEHPQYTFSFYLLIVLHAAATVFFATFNGRYLRYEHELEKEAAKEQRRLNKEQASTAFYPVQGQQSVGGLHYSQSGDSHSDQEGERHPLTGQSQPIA